MKKNRTLKELYTVVLDEYVDWCHKDSRKQPSIYGVALCEFIKNLNEEHYFNKKEWIMLDADFKTSWKHIDPNTRAMIMLREDIEENHEAIDWFWFDAGDYQARIAHLKKLIYL